MTIVAQLTPLIFERGETTEAMTSFQRAAMLERAA